MSRVQKAHEIIGMRLSYDAADLVGRVVASYDPALLGNLLVSDAKELAAYVHLGYVPASADVCGVVNDAVIWATDHFATGDMREVRGGWFRPLSLGMLLCLLVKDDERLRSICSWVRPTRRTEYQGPLEDEVQLLYLVLAGQFQEAAGKRFEKLRDKIAACRSRNVRALSKALEAVLNRDQATFAAATEACVRHHMMKARPAPDATYMEDWLPLHANAIYLAGLALGLERPDYPPLIRAYLMTPESVGCAKTIPGTLDYPHP